MQDGTCINMTIPVFKESKYLDKRKINVNERTFETFAARACPSGELIQQHRIHSDIPYGIVRPRPGPPAPPLLSLLLA